MQVTKLDTLAGLAVRYNVNVCHTGLVKRASGMLLTLPLTYLQVSDIKRANGLLSDTAMFAKDQLLIPTRSIPIGYVHWPCSGFATLPSVVPTSPVIRLRHATQWPGSLVPGRLT